MGATVNEAPMNATEDAAEDAEKAVGGSARVGESALVVTTRRVLVRCVNNNKCLKGINVITNKEKDDPLRYGIILLVMPNTSVTVFRRILFNWHMCAACGQVGVIGVHAVERIPTHSCFSHTENLTLIGCSVCFLAASQRVFLFGPISFRSHAKRWMRQLTGPCIFVWSWTSGSPPSPCVPPARYFIVLPVLVGDEVPSLSRVVNKFFAGAGHLLNTRASFYVNMTRSKLITQ